MQDTTPVQRRPWARTADLSCPNVTAYPTDDTEASDEGSFPDPVAGDSPECGEDSYRGSGRLRGRIALITGGSSGLGRAVAIAYAREGADVAIAHFDEHENARSTLALVRAAGQRGLTLSGDLADPGHCRRIVARTAAELGPLDILVNAASSRGRGQLQCISPLQLERTFRINLFASVWLAQAALELMKPGGVIINTGSRCAVEGDASLIDFAASKGAVHALTKSLARSVERRGVRVNCVAPGPISSDVRMGAGGHDQAALRPILLARLAGIYVNLACGEGYGTGEVVTPALPGLAAV